MPVYSGAKPPVASQGWALTVDGRVDNPGLFSIDHLKRCPATQMRTVRICAGNHSLPVRMHTWHGVTMHHLLSLTRPIPDTAAARIHALDGYVTHITWAMIERALIAWRCDDIDLTPAQGAPARLLIPQRAGHKQIKWLSRITLVGAAELETCDRLEVEGVAPLRGWIDRGWEAGVHLGQRQIITGSIFSAESADQLRATLHINGGLGYPLALVAADADRLRWQADWTPPMPGQYQIELRVQLADVTAVDRLAVTVSPA